MNRIEINSDHWVERYLAGRLSDPEARRLEAYWIENPELIDDMERGARLKAGLADLHERRELDSALRVSWWPGRMRLLALAASVAMVALGATLWINSRVPAGPLLAAAPIGLPALGGATLPRGRSYALLRMRSSAPVDAIVELPVSPEALELRILPDVAGSDSAAGLAAEPVRVGVLSLYTLRIDREDASGTLHEALPAFNLPAAADGFVSAFIDSRTLQPGRYRLRLEATGGDAAAAVVSDFTIAVRGGRARP